jgi:hypothetical protein
VGEIRSERNMTNLVRIVEIAYVALVGEIRSESNNSSFTVNNSLNMNISVLQDVTSRSMAECRETTGRNCYLQNGRVIRKLKSPPKTFYIYETKDET